MPGRRCGHALVAAALCCACVGVAGIELDDVMAALPAETRALLSKQNAEVMAMTDTIFGEFDSDKDGQLSHGELQALLEMQLASKPHMKDGTPYRGTEQMFDINFDLDSNGLADRGETQAFFAREEGMFDALDGLAADFVAKGLGTEDWRRFVGGKEEL